jgi:hypothetical protein
MTPLPDQATADEIEIVKEKRGRLRLRCPVWTEDGRSDLTLECVVRSRGEFAKAEVDRLVTADGDGLPLRPAAAPPSPTGGDTRIRRRAFVGMSYGLLFGQIEHGIARAVGPRIYESRHRLSPGQRAVMVLLWAFGYVYGGSLLSLSDGAPEVLAEAPDAARRVGAEAYARLFERAAGAGDDEEALGAIDDEIYALEDSGDLIWTRMLRYVEAHPDEFFVDG